MNILYFTDKTGLPVKIDNILWNPIEVVNGYILPDNDNSRSLLNDMNISFTSINNSMILRYEYIHDEETGDFLSKNIPDTGGVNYYNIN